MLVQFVYLNKSTLKDYAAQVDGGVITVTETTTAREGSAGATVGVKWVGLNFGGKLQGEKKLTLSDAPAARFQRILAHATEDSDALAWIDVLEPETAFESAQVGEIISWECDVDISNVSRMVASDGAGARLLKMYADIAGAVADGGIDLSALGGSNPQPEQAAAQIQATRVTAEIVRIAINALNASRAVVGKDDDTVWSIFGSIDGDYLRTDDIDNERLIVVGKIKRLIRTGETRQLIDVSAIQNVTRALAQQ